MRKTDQTITIFKMNKENSKGYKLENWTSDGNIWDEYAENSKGYKLENWTGYGNIWDEYTEMQRTVMVINGKTEQAMEIFEMNIQKCITKDNEWKIYNESNKCEKWNRRNNKKWG